MEISFRSDVRGRDRDNLVRFLRKSPLKYPRYEDWLERAMSEIDDGWKDCMLAFSDGKLVANLISQPHKQFPQLFCELKNARCLPYFQDGGFLRFMIRQREKLAIKEGYKAMIGDTSSDNLRMIHLMLTAGYREEFRASLYSDHREEVVFVKPLNGFEVDIFSQLL